MSSNDKDVEAEAATLASYWRCLRNNPGYRNLWLADFIDNIGAWLNYVATLELVSAFTSSSLALSAVVLIRFLPSLVLSPLAGVLADSCNRLTVLIAAALADAVFVAGLAFIHRPDQVVALFLLLAAQFTAIALMDPSRKAIIPVLVPPEQLHLATTLETFSWSITGALGAALGGWIASRLGNSTCFLLDAVTYLLAAWCAYQVPRSLGDPHAEEQRGKGTFHPGAGKEGARRRAADQLIGLELAGRTTEEQYEEEEDLEGAAGEVTPLLAPGLAPAGSSGSAAEAAAMLAEGEAADARSDRRRSLQAAGPHGAPPYSTSVAPAPERDMRHGSSGSAGTALLSAGLLTELHAGSRMGNNNITTTSSISIGIAAGQAWEVHRYGRGVLTATRAACAEGVRSFLEGWNYLKHPENRDLAALVLMKGCGSATWGAVDVLNVRFSELPDMQVGGDSATTLGLIFATVGLGCFLGPVVLNTLVPPRPVPLMWACTASFGLLFLGSVMMTAAQSLTMFLASSFVRAIGSATLWIYSSLLLQLRTPNAILGRVSATEMAFYVCAEAASSVFGGAAFDILHLSLRATVAVLTVLAGLVAAGWALYTLAATRDMQRGKGEAARGGHD